MGICALPMPLGSPLALASDADDADGRPGTVGRTGGLVILCYLEEESGFRCVVTSCEAGPIRPRVSADALIIGSLRCFVSVPGSASDVCDPIDMSALVPPIFLLRFSPESCSWPRWIAVWSTVAVDTLRLVVPSPRSIVRLDPVAGVDVTFTVSLELPDEAEPAREELAAKPFETWSPSCCGCVGNCSPDADSPPPLQLLVCSLYFCSIACLLSALDPLMME